MGARSAAEVARAAGIAPQTLDGYLKGAVPSADRAFGLADALGVNVRWLVKGDGPRSDSAESGSDWLLLPRYDLSRFEEGLAREPVETVRIRRDWVSRAVRATGHLWVTELISDSPGDIAREGDLVLCEDVSPPLRDNHVYIFLLDGRPLVRRVLIRPEGLMLMEANPMIGHLIDPDRIDRFVPAGRVLATINLRAV